MTETRKIFIAIFVILGAVIIFTAPLLHINFAKKPHYQANFEKKINTFNSNKDAELCNLKEQRLQGKISAKEYIEQFELFQIDRESEAELLQYQLKDLIDKNRVFGFKTTRIFLIGFGIRLPYLFFSISILFLFLYGKNKLKANIHLYRSVQILYSTSFLISFYMIIWFLLPRDLPVVIYHILISVLSILGTIGSIFLIRYYYSKKTDFLVSYKIKELVRFITSLRKSYVLDFAVKATNANPDLKKEVKTKLGEFDEELRQTMLKVAKNKS